MKNFTILAIVLALFFVAGWIFGRRTAPGCPEPVPIVGTVPADTVTAGMTETKPDTVFVPKLVPVPGPERIVYLPDTTAGAPEVVPIETVPTGPERDSALYAAAVDWNTARRYTGTLFDDPAAGRATYDFTIQFNRAGAIDYRFDPVPVVSVKPRRWGVGVQAGYGLTVRNDRTVAAPYIGVGIQYNLFSF